MIDALCTVKITPYPIVPYQSPKNHLFGVGLLVVGGGAGATLATLTVLGSLSFPPAALAALLAISALTFLYGAYVFLKNPPQSIVCTAPGRALGIAVSHRNQEGIQLALRKISSLSPEQREKERQAWKEFVWDLEKQGMPHDLWARWVNESLKTFVCPRAIIPRNLSKVLT